MRVPTKWRNTSVGREMGKVGSEAKAKAGVPLFLAGAWKASRPWHVFFLIDMHQNW